MGRHKITSWKELPKTKETPELDWELLAEVFDHEGYSMEEAQAVFCGYTIWRLYSSQENRAILYKVYTRRGKCIIETTNFSRILKHLSKKSGKKITDIRRISKRSDTA